MWRSVLKCVKHIATYSPVFPDSIDTSKFTNGLPWQEWWQKNKGGANTPPPPPPVKVSWEWIIVKERLSSVKSANCICYFPCHPHKLIREADIFVLSPKFDSFRCRRKSTCISLVIGSIDIFKFHKIWFKYWKVHFVIKNKYNTTFCE